MKDTTIKISILIIYVFIVQFLINLGIENNQNKLEKINYSNKAVMEKEVKRSKEQGIGSLAGYFNSNEFRGYSQEQYVIHQQNTWLRMANILLIFSIGYFLAMFFYSSRKLLLRNLGSSLFFGMLSTLVLWGLGLMFTSDLKLLLVFGTVYLRLPENLISIGILLWLFFSMIVFIGMTLSHSIGKQNQKESTER